MVTCEICKKQMKVITNTHLVRHDTTQVEYLKEYPNAKMISDESKSKLLESRKNIVYYKTWEDQFGKEESDKRKMIWRATMNQRITDGTIKRSLSGPHELLLKNLRIKYPNVKWEPEYTIKYYDVDIAVVENRLVVEVDGDYFHNKDGVPFEQLDVIQKKTAKNDVRKTIFLTKKGWRIIRFWESEINENIDGVIAKIGESISLTPIDATTVWYEGRRKECIICNKQLTSRQIASKYEVCSLKCRSINRLNRRRRVPCRYCGKEIIYYKRKEFCDIICSGNYVKEHRQERDVKSGESVKKSTYHSALRENTRITLTCPCGKEFWTYKKRAANGTKYCSIRCASNLRKGTKHES